MISFIIIHTSQIFPKNICLENKILFQVVTKLKVPILPNEKSVLIIFDSILRSHSKFKFCNRSLRKKASLSSCEKKTDCYIA